MQVSWQYLLLISLLPVIYGSFERQDIRSISSGLSFGRCRGYCQQAVNITLNPLQLVAVKQPNFAQATYPVLRQQHSYSSSQWDELVSLVNAEALTSSADTIGCPGCADGGIEWVQVNWADGVKRVTFESGATIEGLQALIEKMQQMRNEYLSQF